MEATFLPIVKPELKQEFLKVWDKWFVLEDTVRDEKTPGKLKGKKYLKNMTEFIPTAIFVIVEWETTDGCIVALCNKMYKCHDRTTKTDKRSTKGIPHSIKIEMEQFKACLLQTNYKPHFVELNSLRLDANKQMCRTSTYKKGLSDIFIKLHVSSDKISCSPLSINDKYL